MTVNNFSNKTLYGIESKTMRQVWAGHFIFILLSSAIGDTTILVAPIKYNAIRLNKLIVVTIQHIAVCDLLVCLLCVSVGPRALSLIADGWVLGGALCYILTYTAYYFVPVGLFLICSMTTWKLLILNYPLRVKSWSVKHAHTVSALIWTSLLILPIILLLTDHGDVAFNYRTYVCDYGFTSSTWTWLRPTLATIFVFTPNIFVVASTLCLLVMAHKVARRGRESLKWQGITTTVLVAAVYCISVLPYSIYHFAESSVEDQRSFLHSDFSRIAESCLYMNTISNFYIYCLTVSSFREFLTLRIQRSLPFLFNNGDRNSFKPYETAAQNRPETPCTSGQGN